MRYGGLIAAVIFAALAAVVVLRTSGSSAPAPTTAAPVPEVKNTNIYVATKPLPVGTTIGEADIGVQPWPEQLVLDGFVQADGKTNLVGMVSRAPMQQNEPITFSKVANPNDPNFLAGDLPKGMRVVTIPINETDGVAGFVFPGDHVDMIYTHDVPKWVIPPASVKMDTSGSGNSSSETSVAPQKTMVTVTETLLTNVKVLAIDQRSSGAGAVDAKGTLIIPRSASMMVSATDSQRVRLASKTGTISLVLRSLADKESADPLVITRPQDISQSKSAETDVNDGQQQQPEVSSIKISRGAPKSIKEMESGGVAVSNGAPIAGGTVPSRNGGVGNPVGALPSGSSVVTPGLAAF